jgi:hypothetical protein
MCFARLTLAVLTGVVLLALPATGVASPRSCAEAILVDSRDGRLDREYPVACYRTALERLPEDLRVYGTAESDIRRALMGAVSRSATGSDGRVSQPAAAGAPLAASGTWLAIAGGIAVLVGIVALASLHSVRSRRRH